MWATLNKEQVVAAEAAALEEDYEWAEDYDWETLGRGCAAQLQRSQSIISSSTFSASLDNVLTTAKLKLTPGQVIQLYFHCISGPSRLTRLL